jgi:hypothetical protein
MRKADQPQSKRKKLLVSRPVYIYLNEFKEQDEEIKLYVNENQLRAEIQDDLKNEKKIFITSNSKEKITRLHQYLIGEFPAKQFLFVTSENSRDADVQAIILDIKNKISNFDAVLTSPSLSTGIDITFPDDEKIIDVVYGLFEQKITDHFEIDQQIRRVRHPKEVKVWISPQKFYFETNIAALSAADQVNTLLANTHADFDAVPLKNEWGNKSAFFRMSTSIESKRRASFNDLKENFRRYKEEQGYRVIEIEKNKDLAKLGKEIKNKSTDNERQQRVEVILTAKPIDQRKFIAIKQALKNLQVVSASDRLSYKKSSIEFIYRREANEQIIADYLDHRVRCIFVLEELLFFSATADADSASSKDMIKELKISDIRQKINQQHPEVISIQSIEVLAVLLLDILSETPLFSGGKFDSDKLFKKSDFDQFVAAVKQYKNVLSTYKIPVRSDIAHNPIRFLGELLRLVGLKTEKHSRDQSGQQTDYLYQLEKSSFNFMMEIIERRKSLPPDDYIKTYWKAVHQRQGFTTPIYVCSPNDWGFDEWEILMDEDLEEIFKNRKAGRSSDSWFKVLANE